MASWLDGEKWAEITREERQFCADLYLEIRDQPSEFVRFIKECKPKETPAESLDEELDWEVAYEMAYYRDLIYSKKAKGVECKGSLHRKFDLALISDHQLIIVEAKAQQGFTTDDEKAYKADLKDIRASRNDQGVAVFLVALCSSRLFNSYKREIEIEQVADYVITWKDLAEKSVFTSTESKESFCRADDVYGK